MDNLPLWLQLGIALVWASFAALVAYLQNFAVVEEKRPKFSWLESTIKILTGGFAGALTLLLIANKGVDYRFALFLVAIAGWGGAETVIFLQEVFRGALKRFAEKSDDRDPQGS